MFYQFVRVRNILSKGIFRTDAFPLPFHFQHIAADAHRYAVEISAVVAEDTALAQASQIQPHTFRLDRTRLLEYARRRLLGSRVGDLYYGIYRWL